MKGITFLVSLSVGEALWVCRYVQGLLIAQPISSVQDPECFPLDCLSALTPIDLRRAFLKPVDASQAPSHPC